MQKKGRLQFLITVIWLGVCGVATPALWLPISVGGGAWTDGSSTAGNVYLNFYLLESVKFGSEFEAFMRFFHLSTPHLLSPPLLVMILR